MESRHLSIEGSIELLIVLKNKKEKLLISVIIADIGGFFGWRIADAIKWIKVIKGVSNKVTYVTKR